MIHPRFRPFDGEQLVLRDDLFQIFHRCRRRYTKFAVRCAVRVLEHGVHLLFSVVKDIAAMLHAKERGGHEERSVEIVFVAELIEQAQCVGLIVHAGPVVEQFVAAAPKYNGGMAAQFADHSGRFLFQNL